MKQNTGPSLCQLLFSVLSTSAVTKLPCINGIEIAYRGTASCDAIIWPVTQ